MLSVDEVLELATKAHMAGDLPKAEALYCQIIAHAEDHPAPYFYMGTLYAQARATGRALTFLHKAIDLEPGNYQAMQNLGTAYRQMDRCDKAIEWNKKSLEINRNAYVLSNLAGCYVNQGDPQSALHYADEALAMKPDLAEAGNHRALALLEMGNFEAGWAQYDARMHTGEFTKRDFGSAPMWDGGKVGELAIHGEQGLGDEILFCTFVKKALTRADKIVLECSPRLIRVFEHSFRSLPVRMYGTHEEVLANCTPDAWIPMGSLPRLLWPFEKWAYLQSSQKYEKGNWPRIGISWKGGTQKTHEALRNAPIEAWRPLIHAARTMGMEVISLQYGPADEMASKLEVPHDAAGIADMDVLTAMVQSCDLVISVCNTTVHQAGASNTPCWQLVPSKPDWRCQIRGDKYYWYDSVDFIRQKDGETWESVLLRTTEQLKKWGEQLPPRLIE